MESRFKYGVLGAGAVSASLIGRLPLGARDLGPISAVSYRVASRIANTLRAGHAVRSADELNAAPVILFHSPPDHMERLLEILERARIEWSGKSLIFCDCLAGNKVRQRLEARGASIAVAREFVSPGRIIVEADGGAASHVVHAIARELRIKAVDISPGCADLFDAAVTLASAAITPLIDRAAALLRDAGIRDVEAARIASSLFEQTARDYVHSGKQSWVWYVRKPLSDRLAAQIAAVEADLEPVLRQLLVFGLDTFGKHREVADAIAPASGKPRRQRGDIATAE